MEPYSFFTYLHRWKCRVRICHLKGGQYKNPLLTQRRVRKKGELYEKVTESKKKDEGQRYLRKDCPLFSAGLFICGHRYRVRVPFNVKK